MACETREASQITKQVEFLNQEGEQVAQVTMSAEGATPEEAQEALESSIESFMNSCDDCAEYGYVAEEAGEVGETGATAVETATATSTFSIGSVSIGVIIAALVGTAWVSGIFVNKVCQKRANQVCVDPDTCYGDACSSMKEVVNLMSTYWWAFAVVGVAILVFLMAIGVMKDFFTGFIIIVIVVLGLYLLSGLMGHVVSNFICSFSALFHSGAVRQACKNQEAGCADNRGFCKRQEAKGPDDDARSSKTMQMIIIVSVVAGIALAFFIGYYI